MKNTLKLLCVIALVAVIGFSVVACGGGGDDDGNNNNNNNSNNNGGDVIDPNLETVETPTASLEQGTYTETQSVTLSCATTGASMHYTTNGNTPTASSTTYSGAISISSTTTLKAIAVKSGMNNSGIFSATYTINNPTTTPPTALTPSSLGLQVGIADFTGSNIYTAMEKRWDNAQNKIGGDGTTRFYPIYGTTPGASPTVHNISVDGETLDGVGIYGRSPEMIFLIKGSKLTVWGRNDTSGSTISISFDIVVIKNSDNTGWLSQGAGGTAYKTESYAYGNNHSTEFTLSDLTGGTITTAPQLGTNYATYSVYIIVRELSQASVLGDLNTYVNPSNGLTLKDCNVIKPVIK